MGTAVRMEVPASDYAPCQAAASWSKCSIQDSQLSFFQRHSSQSDVPADALGCIRQFELRVRLRHAIACGAAAAQFLQEVRRLLENPISILL